MATASGTLLRVLALLILCLLPAAEAAAQSSDAWYEVPVLNEGLGEVPRGIDRSTPRGTVESLFIVARLGGFDEAAHLLNLNDYPPEEQAEVGPELARMLETIFARKVLVDWDDLLDRPDALDAGASDRSAVAGQPRRSIRIWSMSLDGRPVSIRLNRVKPEDGEPVWVFARQTVANLPALFARYGPSRFEKALPDWAREPTPLGIMVWEMIGLPVFLLTLLVVGVGIKRGLDWLWRRVENAYVTEVLRAIRGPTIFGAVTLLAWFATTSIFVFSGRIDAFLTPLVLLGAVTSVLWFFVNSLDAVIDRLAGFGRSDLSSRQEQEHRALATRIAAGRRALIVVIVLIGGGIVLSSSGLFENLGLSLIGTAGALTLVLGFAARRVLGNIMSSMQIALNQSARIGDRIVWNDHLCHVERINFTFVQLRDWDGTRVIVPVEEFASEAFVNWTLQDPDMLRILKIKCTHDADVDALREIFREVIDELDPEELGDKDDAAVNVAGQDVFGIDVWFSIPCSDPNTSWDVACSAREKLMAKASEVARKEKKTFFPEVQPTEAA